MKKTKVSEAQATQVSKYIRYGFLDQADGYVKCLGFNTMVEFYESLDRMGSYDSIVDLALYYANDFDDDQKKLLFEKFQKILE